MNDVRYAIGTGRALPERVMANSELEANLGLPNGWIAQRTGIEQRHVEEDGFGVSRLATRAGQRALEAAKLEPSEVGCVILATSTPDRLLPPTAPAVAAELGVHGGAFDLAGACAGFVQALLLADGMFAAQANLQGALVIGANLLSRRVAWNDADTAVLFGDGAGAVALRRADGGSDGVRILGGHMSSAGEHADLIEIPAGGSQYPATVEACERGDTRMRMHDGASLLRHAVRAMRDAGRVALMHADINVAALNWLVPHQANGRVLHKLAAALGIEESRVLRHLRTVGNTSAASIPIALDVAMRDGRVRHGQTLLLTAAGAGLTSAAIVIQV